MDVHPLSGVGRYFDDVPGPRRFNVTYTLGQLLTCTLMAALCRCDDYEEIAGWTLARHDWLVEVLGMPGARSPCRKTFERLFRRLDPKALQKCFTALTARLAEVSKGRPGGWLIAIDGKTLRGLFDHAHRALPIHLVHAWDRANGLMLGQVAVDEKSNEITAVPALLDLLDVQDAVVSLDATPGGARPAPDRHADPSTQGRLPAVHQGRSAELDRGPEAVLRRRDPAAR